MLYSVYAVENLTRLAAGGLRSEQRHFDSVSVVSSDSLQTCQPTTDTDSRCFFDVTNRIEYQNKRRAEPLAWPCSFALPGLTARGTLQAYAGWRTWGYNTLSTLYPQVSNTTEYCSTSGCTPPNKCTNERNSLLGVVQCRAGRIGETVWRSTGRKQTGGGNLSRLRQQ